MITLKQSINRNALRFAGAAICLLPFVSAASAATATSNFTTQITLGAACNVNSASNIDFGSHGVLTADVPGTSTIKVQCTNTTTYNIGLDAGGGTGATVADRLMSNGSNTVKYSLYQDSGHATVWGNTITTDTVSSTGTGAEQSFTVYGLVPAQTTPAPGIYNDTVNVTVTF